MAEPEPAAAILRLQRLFTDSLFSIGRGAGAIATTATVAITEATTSIAPAWATS